MYKRIVVAAVFVSALGASSAWAQAQQEATPQELGKRIEVLSARLQQEIQRSTALEARLVMELEAKEAAKDKPAAAKTETKK